MENNKSLIQKIRENLAFNITGYKNTFPSKRQLSNYFLSSVKDKPYYWTYTLHSILTLKTITKIDYASTLITRDKENSLLEAFKFLEKNQYDKCIVTEISYCPKPLPESNCICIVKDVFENITEFSIVFFNENFKDEDYQTVTVQKNENNQINIIFQYGKNSSIIENKKIITEAYLDLAINTFIYFSNNPTGKFFGLEGAKKIGDLNMKYEPPLDSILTQYLEEVKNGYRYCIKAKVDIEKVEPFSYAHAYDIPETYIFDTIEDIIDFENVSILTYTHGDKYIMSDDYVLYLALKILDIKKITIVNLGDLIDKKLEIIEKGGIELLPPIMFKQIDFNSLPKEEQKRRLEDKLYTIKSIKKLKSFLLSDFLDIKNEISNDELGKAILQLKPFICDDNNLNILTSINARLSKLRNDIQLGVIRYEDEILEFNKIRINLLRFIDDLK
jgi:Effector-associated domain 11